MPYEVVNTTAAKPRPCDPFAFTAFRQVTGGPALLPALILLVAVLALRVMMRLPTLSCEND